MINLNYLETKDYLEAERKLKAETERFGTITWANGSETPMIEAYSRLIDIFAPKTRKKVKKSLLETMIRNSGFSKDYVNREIRPPLTEWYNFFDEETNEKYYLTLAVCIYPPENDQATYYHEGVHFLANHGSRKNRIIEHDVPLANILGTFFRLRKNPVEELEYLTGLPSKNGLEDHAFLIHDEVGINPFTFKFKENSEIEVAEADLFAVTAYQISLKHGEETALKFIKEMYKQGCVAHYLRKNCREHMYDQYLFDLNDVNEKWSNLLK